jgi:hypothetical protein
VSCRLEADTKFSRHVSTPTCQAYFDLVSVDRVPEVRLIPGKLEPNLPTYPGAVCSAVCTTSASGGRSTKYCVRSTAQGRCKLAGSATLVLCQDAPLISGGCSRPRQSTVMEPPRLPNTTSRSPQSAIGRRRDSMLIL